MMDGLPEVQEFLSDLRRFGKVRALARDAHRGRLREFKLRQKQLAVCGFAEIGLLAISGNQLFAVLAVLFFWTATRECWRMRACGRYWQCKRSMEVIGI